MRLSGSAPASDQPDGKADHKADQQRDSENSYDALIPPMAAHTTDTSSTLQRRHYLIWREPVPEQRQRAWRFAPIVSGPLLPPQVELPDAKTAAYGLRLLCSWLSA